MSAVAKSRATNQQIIELSHAINRRLTVAKTGRQVAVNSPRRGYGRLGAETTYELVEFRPDDPFVTPTITTGTKREIVDFLSAMAAGIEIFAGSV